MSIIWTINTSELIISLFCSSLSFCIQQFFRCKLSCLTNYHMLNINPPNTAHSISKFVKHLIYPFIILFVINKSKMIIKWVTLAKIPTLYLKSITIIKNLEKKLVTNSGCFAFLREKMIIEVINGSSYCTSCS